MTDHNMADYFNTVEQENFAEYKDRGSKFLAYLFPINSVDDFKKQLAKLKSENPKANHHCFAYRLGLDQNNYRASDDGEPSGTAGKPILGQIDSKKLTNVLIVVVRYFGGTLLGVPGLINAYKLTASMVLQTTPIVRKPILKDIKIEFDYTNMNAVMQIVKQANAEILAQEAALFCSMHLGVPKIMFEETHNRLKDIYGVIIKS